MRLQKLVQVVDVGLQVVLIVNFHGFLVNVRFQVAETIGEGEIFKGITVVCHRKHLQMLGFFATLCDTGQGYARRLTGLPEGGMIGERREGSMSHVLI